MAAFLLFGNTNGHTHGNSNGNTIGKRSNPYKMRLTKDWLNTRGNTGGHIDGNADGTQTRSKEINNVVVNTIQ